MDADSRNKIGIGLVIGSGLLFVLGIMLFFDRSLLIIANLCFLSGMYFLVGISGTINFFFKNKKGRIKGTALYIGGLFIMIVIRLPFMSFIGFCVQISGIIVVFRDFLPWLKSYTFAIPVVGKYLRSAIDFLAPQKKAPV